jgi:hypothetical protein
MGSQDEHNTGGEPHSSSGRFPSFPRPEPNPFDVEDLLVKMHLGEHSRIGPYELRKEIGHGALGVVYIAKDHNLDRDVAIKRVKDQTPEFREHVVREAKAMAQLSHPNVVPVYEIREHGDMTWIVMEYVQGVTLNQWLREKPRTIEEISRVFMAAGAGLAAAHAHKLVHRDFKPANVMIGLDDRVRVMDFGLACPDPGQEPTMGREPAAPQHDSGGGTPAYMAPEQFRRRWADARTDQFSFCVALHEALYGERPFAGSTREQVWTAAERGEIRPEPPHTTVPKWLRQVVVRGLAPDPRGRFESMQALLDALGAKGQDVVDSVATWGSLSGSTPVSDRPRRRVVAYAAVVGLVVMSTVVTLVVQPYMFPTVVEIEACVVRVEGGGGISRAWIVLEDGGEYEVEVAGKLLRFSCVGKNELATVIAEFDGGELKHWSSVELTGDDTLRVSDAKSGWPADLPPDLERVLDENLAGTQEKAVATSQQGSHDETIPGCTIDGGTHKAAGDLDPSNACQVCAPETNASGWSHVAAGTSCGTGKVCAQGSCVAACFIAGVLHDANATNPTNPCQTCQPNESTTAWKKVADGTSCGNGQTCVNASCGSQCVIKGEVYASGAENPANACERCQPGTSVTAWTTNKPANLGESCGSCGGKVLCDGTCSVETPASFGMSCNSCGGTIECNGACSTTPPPNLNQSCGSCGGTVQCDGSCSVKTPGNFGASCNSCGGTVKCDGSCSTSQPGNFGASCNSCNGTVQCDGSCWPPQPGDYGSVRQVSQEVETFACCSFDYTKNFGGACSSGWIYDSVKVDKLSGGGACLVHLVPVLGSNLCQVTLRFHNNGLEGAECKVTVFERRGC